MACSGCGSGAEFWRRFTRVIGFRWTARRPSRAARRAAQVAGLVRSTSARTLAGAEGPRDWRGPTGLDGWRWEGGDEIKAAGEVLRPSARSYLSQRIGGWPASRPWPAAIREVPQPGLRKWQGVTGRYWPVELSCIGVLLFGFFAPGEAEPGALQAEAYTRDGRRVPHRGNGENVRRWTLGKTEGRVFQVAPAFKSPVGVAICEGPTAALAIAAVRPRVLVLAVGGGLASSILHVRGASAAGPAGPALRRAGRARGGAGGRRRPGGARVRRGAAVAAAFRCTVRVRLRGLPGRAGPGEDGVTGQERPLAGVAPPLEEAVRCPLLDRDPTSCCDAT